MDIQAIVADLRQQVSQLDSAIAALEGIGGKPRLGRPKGKRRHMSASARARISAAMKARWAKRKKAA
jgi:hypothetical protein